MLATARPSCVVLFETVIHILELVIGGKSLFMEVFFFKFGNRL